MPPATLASQKRTRRFVPRRFGSRYYGGAFALPLGSGENLTDRERMLLCHLGGWVGGVPQPTSHNCSFEKDQRGLVYNQWQTLSWAEPNHAAATRDIRRCKSAIVEESWIGKSSLSGNSRSPTLEMSTQAAWHIRGHYWLLFDARGKSILEGQHFQFWSLLRRPSPLVLQHADCFVLKWNNIA